MNGQFEKKDTLDHVGAVLGQRIRQGTAVR